MKTTDLIEAILREADSHGDTIPAYDTVRPLKRFGQIWFADGHWWFSEQIAEIAMYTANGSSISRFGEGQFEVKHLTDEDYERAKQSWGGRL